MNLSRTVVTAAAVPMIDVVGPGVQSAALGGAGSLVARRRHG